MTEKLPLTSVVAVPIDDPLLIRFIVLPASAVPLIIGVVSFVEVSVVVITGWLGAVVSISIGKPTDSADVFPARSVALTVNV